MGRGGSRDASRKLPSRGRSFRGNMAEDERDLARRWTVKETPRRRDFPCPEPVLGVYGSYRPSIYWTRVRRHRVMRHAPTAAALSLLLLTFLSLGCDDSDNELSGTTFDAVGVMHPGTNPGGSPGPGE